jgi:hypothetical protein
MKTPDALQKGKDINNHIYSRAKYEVCMKTNQTGEIRSWQVVAAARVWPPPFHSLLETSWVRALPGRWFSAWRA